MKDLEVTPSQPVLIICCGVSGSGKTTLARDIAGLLNWMFVEADDFHSAENKAHMAAGKPLSDLMREPWIAGLCEHLQHLRQQGHNCVMANSGLRRAHRQRFRELGYPTLFLHLHGPLTVIQQRMQVRTGHYMPTTLLESQFAALEDPSDEPDVHCIDIEQSPQQIAERARVLIGSFLSQIAGD